MSVDLTGGLDERREFVFAGRPEDPEMRESVNAWVWDAGEEVGLPRIGIEAIANRWETHDVQVNIALGDGRVLHVFEPGKAHDPLGADGRPRVLGAGPLAFEMVEPFRRWRVTLDGEATATTVDDEIAGRRATAASRVPVRLDLELTSAAPPWESGTLLAETARILAEQEEGAFVGGPRYEQLSWATGTLRVGDREHHLRGGALRIHRQGVRRLNVGGLAFWGHAWQSAIFPSGRGFGCLAFPPRPDGKPTFNEGYLFEGDGALVPARIVEAPWLRVVRPRGDDVSVVLETERGTVTIRGETLMSTFLAIPNETDRFPVLQQAIVRYTWDGETANGMMERSMTPDKVARPA